MHCCFRYTCLVGVGLVVVVFGCHSAEEPYAEAGTATTPIATTPSTGVPDGSLAEPTVQSAGDSKPEQSGLSATAAAAHFTPPFPDRLELFEPPKRAQSAVRQNDVEGQSVELKGFVNVDKPRVLLAIDGVISPIDEGGEKYGVQVISIQPPSVVLQRGRSRWTATLE